MGTVRVRYTIGAGNNIFQYVYARLLADVHGLNLSTQSLPFIDVSESLFPFDESLPVTQVGLGESDFHKYLDVSRKPSNYLVYTYPEDYTVYKPHLNKIRGWFKDVPKTNNKDLVFHLRLGDRLITARDYHSSMKIEVEEYIDVINQFEYEKLYIVTDMKVWRTITENELGGMRFHISIPREQRIDTSVAVEHFNSLVNGLNKLNPIVRCSMDLKEDFNFMRSFDKILFQHGTLAWWAATLSYASRVGVFGPWRPIKGDRNKNLGKTDFEGWFRWGESRNSLQK